MRICGLQRLTLLDFPGEVACTIFTGGCNFRCPFCHNRELVLSEYEPDEISMNELLAFLKKRRKVLDGVCISGGEPLINPDIEGLIRPIKELGYKVKLDTNGSYPRRLKSLAEQSLLDYIAMDIKNSLERYAETIGEPFFPTDEVEESAAFLLSGTIPYEFRTTAVKELHEERDFCSIGKWLAGAQNYFLQCYEHSDYVIASGLHAHSQAGLERFIAILRETIPSAKLRGE